MMIDQCPRRFVSQVLFTLMLGLTVGLACPDTARAEGETPTLDPEVVSFTVERSYDEVREALENALINRGYVVDHVARIGEMLNRTAEAVGASRNVYSQAEALQFCSAILSRNAMEADPMNIAFCPYVLFIFERADKPGMVTVGHRRMGRGANEKSSAALAAVNDLLTEIAEEAAEGF